MAPLILLVLPSGPAPADPPQRHQPGPPAQLLSHGVRRQRGAVPRPALRRGRGVRGPVRARLPGQHRFGPHRPADPQEGGPGGLPRCHNGSSGAQAAQHASGSEETVGVSIRRVFCCLWQHLVLVHLFHSSLGSVALNVQEEAFKMEMCCHQVRSIKI